MMRGTKTPQAWLAIAGRFGVLAATILGLAYIFKDSAHELLRDWLRDDYSHGPILPLIALLMAWHRLAGKKLAMFPAWRGLAWLACGMTLLLVGEMSTFRQLSFYGMLVVLIGLSQIYYGAAVTRMVAPAFIVLLFAIPLPFMIYNSLSLDMRLLSSTLGVLILDALNVPVFQDGNIIDLGGYKLQVVEACSGLRYLFPLASFSFIIAYLLKDAWWKRIVLFLSTAPLAIVMNAARIALIGAMADWWGLDLAQGFTHLFEGFVVFLMCTLLLLLEARLLLAIGGKGLFAWDFFSLPRARLSVRPVLNSRPSIAALFLIVPTILITGLSNHVVHSNRRQEQISLATYPLNLGEWHGRTDSLDSYALKELALTDFWIANYTRENSPPVNLYIAYYANQQIGSAVHSPLTCVPGGGWKIISNTEVELPVADPSSKSWHATRLFIQSGGAREIVYYWFDERGRNITNQFSAKWFLLVDSFLKDRSDGALIRLATPIDATETEEIAEQRILAFTLASFPEIKSHLPK